MLTSDELVQIKEMITGLNGNNGGPNKKQQGEEETLLDKFALGIIAGMATHKRLTVPFHLKTNEDLNEHLLSEADYAYKQAGAMIERRNCRKITGWKDEGIAD